MNLFDDHIDRIRRFQEEQAFSATTCDATSVSTEWPAGGKRNVILASDTAVELGNPHTASTSLLLWTGDTQRVQNNTISIIGPDLPESRGKSLPFGRVLLVYGSGFTEENCLDRYRDMERERFNLDLRGYMLRAASQYRREWSRISHGAIDEGLNLSLIGARLIEKISSHPWVEGVEVIFVTLSKETVESLENIIKPASRVIEAMNRLTEDLTHNCGECDLSDVCGSVRELQAMKRAIEKKRKASHDKK